MTSYAAQKGRAAPVAQPAKIAQVRQLTEAEQARTAENRAFIIEHMPEAVQFIKDLHAEGLIEGWRAVINCNFTKTT